jgi:hypothetical protein
LLFILPIAVASSLPTAGEKKKFEIKPGIAGFDKLREKSKTVELILEPPHLVEPPYIEGILRGPKQLKSETGKERWNPMSLFEVQGLWRCRIYSQFYIRIWVIRVLFNSVNKLLTCTRFPP